MAATNNNDFYSQAGNFISSVQGGVDPRTGLFSVSLPLASLHSGNLAGPALALTLQYSPLSPANEGFGTGFSLNLTRYDTGTGKLVLFTGEAYRIDASDNTVRQKKLKNFVFEQSDDSRCVVTHKTGLTEHLSLNTSVYVPSRIEAPDGRGLSLTWSTDSVPRLTEVTDDNNVVLCSVSYPDGQDASTKFSLLPDADADAGYDIVFSFDNDYLVSITSQADTPSLVWNLEYDDVGPGNVYRVITRVTSPTGLAEAATYYAEQGMEFPDAALQEYPSLQALPCVHQHTLSPGNGQPDTVTQWEWTAANYLGKNAQMNQWHPDSDGMLDILLADYRYGSTASMMDTDGSTVLNTVTRRYNSYHLLLSETSVRDGKTYAQTTEYYAQPGADFDDQPAQYALPVSQTESWDAGDGNTPRTRSTRMTFDEAGNPLRQTTPEGTVTEYAYYPAEGEGDACPADPNGFVRWLKMKTVTPRSVTGNEPATVTVNTWKRLDAPDGETYGLVADTVTQTTGRTRTTVTRTYYDDAGETLTYAREKSRTTTLTPDVSLEETFTHRQDFTRQTSGEGVVQTETFTGHDGVTASRSTVRHPHTGLLLSDTNAQGVTVTYTYDRMGRALTRTLAPGTTWENTASWAHSIEDNVPVTTETDASGNQLRTTFDGTGRMVSRQQMDKDDTQRWFDIARRDHNTLGEVVSGTGMDWLTAAGEQYTVSVAVAHDGWGAPRTHTFSDETVNLLEIDPVSLTKSISMSGGTGDSSLSSGTTTTEFDGIAYLPVSETRSDVAGAGAGSRQYTWDGLGRLLTETDELGNKTERTYDEYGRVLTQLLPDGSQVVRTYAPHLTGQQIASISITAPDGQGGMLTRPIGTQTFDSLGRLTGRTSGGRTTTCTYEGASPAPSVVTLPSGKMVSYSYLPALGGRVSSQTADGVSQTFSYDPLTGDLLTATNNSAENHLSWTPSGSLKTEAVVQNGVSREAKHTCTLGGEAVTYTDITGKKTRYIRNGLGRISSITDDALTVSLDYDALGRLSMQTVTDAEKGNTLRTSLTFDDFGREITRTLADGNGSTVALSQGWMENDLLASRTTSRDGSDVRQEAFTYDARNRLTAYTASGSMLPQDGYGYEITAQAYVYDALNNLLTVTTTLSDGSSDTATYHYDSDDDPMQLTSVTHTHDGYPQTVSLAYDANGQMTRDEAGRTLTYDVTGRLTGISSGEIAGAYGYDALNRLVSQQVSETDTRQLYYRGNELVTEVQAQQSRESRFIRNGHSCVGVAQGDALTLTAGDGHDSLLWSRETGQTEGHQHGWSPYGSGAAVDGLPGFNGERADPVSGSYHLGNGYRTYNPVLMRFNSPDSLSPFGAGGINPYAYCAGDPVNHTDPSGHISWQAFIGAALGIIGALSTIISGALFIAAESSIVAALGAASGTTWAVGALGAVADSTAIASGVLEDKNPEASSVLGWVSLATGIAGVVAGVAMPVLFKADSFAAYESEIRRGLNGSRRASYDNYRRMGFNPENAAHLAGGRFREQMRGGAFREQMGRERTNPGRQEEDIHNNTPPRPQPHPQGNTRDEPHNRARYNVSQEQVEINLPPRRSVLRDYPLIRNIIDHPDSPLTVFPRRMRPIEIKRVFLQIHPDKVPENIREYANQATQIMLTWRSRLTAEAMVQESDV